MIFRERSSDLDKVVPVGKMEEIGGVGVQAFLAMIPEDGKSVIYDGL